MSERFKLGDRELAPGCRPYVVAEIGVNYNGELELARRTIDAAAEAGADAAKFQTFRAEEFMADRDLVYEYETAAGHRRESMFEMFKRLELPTEWHRELRDHARLRGLGFLSSSADREAVDLLLELGVPALKLASEDLINLPLLHDVAGRGAPVILSTGMASRAEIDQAVEILRAGGCRELMLLHCVSLYPAPDETLNLRMIGTLRETYGVPVGFSDHSEGIEAAVAAAALGAVMIEKHFTLDRTLPGPDHALSADPEELARLCRAVGRVAAQLGRGDFTRAPAEDTVRATFRRSVVAAVNIPAGAELTEAMLGLKRPGDGIAPARMGELIGRRARRAYRADEQLDGEELS